MQHVFLTRHTKEGTERYYKLELFCTLFDEFVVERQYGNVYYRTPTGIRKNFFTKLEEALLMFETLLAQKKKKGYKAR